MNSSLPMRYTIILIPLLAAQSQAGLLPLGEHVDIRFEWKNGTWSCKAATPNTEHNPQSVSLSLGDKPYVSGNPSNSGARHTQPASAAFAFTGVPAGNPLWIAVQGTPGAGEAWPGFDNNQSGIFGSYIPNDTRVSQTTARPWIKVSLVEHVAPHNSNAHFSMWTSGSPPKVWMSTFSNSSTNDYHYAEGTHNHINWGFNTTGIHRDRLRASAFAGPGSSNPTGFSEVHTFTFAIGPFAQWQAQYFDGNELENTSISGASADPDQDGMNNLIEFGFGLNPRSGGSTPTATGLGLPKMSLQSENGTSYEILTYPRRRANSQIKPLLYQPLFASDLAGPWVSENTITTTSNFPIELNHLNSIWEQVIVTRPVGTTKPVRGFSRVMLQN